MMGIAWSTVLMILAPIAAVPPAPAFDLDRDKVLYCVGYAHLDTQWRWDFCTTIDRYIRDTLEHNFDRFERFPGYVFNFTGSVRYEMMKEYYPQHYERLKQYIADGRWFVSGSSVDEGDVNVPSAEAVIRQVLYGNGFFRREFGKESRDFMLPDCFGFPASMPSVWAHCGLLGFSTQKLTWGSAVGIPFKIGVWDGLDGHGVIAAFDPGAYVGAIEGRVDLNPEWIERIEANGANYGVFADYHYYGVGDQGGAPRAEDIANYLASVDNPDSVIHVALVSSDQMYRDITAEQRARLPRYRGDLLLTEHSAGTLTSQATMKRWNRKNELLADAAERAAVAAFLLNGAAYPRDTLYHSWVRLLANQMHDILPGTSIPRAYRYSWNDEIVAANGFAQVALDGVREVASRLDTQCEGQPLVVYNPLARDRQDVVEATVRFPGPLPAAIRVVDPDGRDVPAQILERRGATMRILFLARTPAVSWSVFDVRPTRAPAPPVDATGLAITARSLQNDHYTVTLNDDGDVASIVDRRLGRELLAGPARLIFTHERPRNWPAWNMDWADRQREPLGAVSGPADIRVVERGPVRVTLEVRRAAQNSLFTQRIQLAAGDAGDAVVFDNTIDWQSASCALKASFPLTAAHDTATYNWGMGTIERGNNNPTQYEVPSHEWLDLTDRSGDFGVTIIEDSKFGSDKPADHELRLTLLYTPGVRGSYLDQHSQDWGRHEIVYGLHGHAGDWRAGEVEWVGRRLNQPLQVVQTTAHAGDHGRRWALARVDHPAVDIRALKLAEESDDIIVRLQELQGRRAEGVEIVFGAAVQAARELDGQERPLGVAPIVDGRLRIDMDPYTPRTFAVRLQPEAQRADRRAPSQIPVVLNYDADVVSPDKNRADGAFDAEGRTLPAEMLPDEVTAGSIRFMMGPRHAGAANAVVCRGQRITLPPAPATHIALLVAATDDVSTWFGVDETAHDVEVPAWTGFVGQWDDRVWDAECEEVDFHCPGHVTAITTGFIKRAPIAWFCTHRHHPVHGNEAYQFSYLFKHVLPIDGTARELRLPDDPRVHLFAATLLDDPRAAVWPAAPLYDDYTGRTPITLRHAYPAPLPPVFEGHEPCAGVEIDRQDEFALLSMGPPVATDLADRSLGAGLTLRFTDNPTGDFTPHHGSGVDGDGLPRLNDGDVSENDDDTTRSVWYDNAGRFHVDLGRPTALSAIHAYSWHKGNRAPQFFSVWGATEPLMPDPCFAPGAHGAWELLAVVDTRGLGNGGVHGSVLRPVAGSAALGPYRHLLWVVEDMGQGTFFTEIDLHAHSDAPTPHVDE